eukprot:CAMPEP_0204596780 /NCGR_PEP_ID=MMETSP0661-20131031/53438_1 /ASSEMBLY_ACC=CAM_ASM_000606 /TAXON_ID=109239 /ORGANISM="Alexandrium margalefi, Strain AMGDE01CS-322" /LENGTH=153 /DNA_ID=CAMNT_0051607425 /DNA_START=43 /DNA_END=501 /DNA_ORIENTATION=+
MVEAGIAGGAGGPGHFSVEAFEEALLFNERLCVMLEEPGAQGPRGEAGPAPCASRRPAPPAPPCDRRPSTCSSRSSSSARCGPHRESSSGVNRRRFEHRVQEENAALRARLAARAQSCGPAVRCGQAAPREGPHAASRRRREQEIQQENAGIA